LGMQPQGEGRRGEGETGKAPNAQQVQLYDRYAASQGGQQGQAQNGQQDGQQKGQQNGQQAAQQQGEQRSKGAQVAQGLQQPARPAGAGGGLPGEFGVALRLRQQMRESRDSLDAGRKKRPMAEKALAELSKATDVAAQKLGEVQDLAIIHQEAETIVP